MKRIVIVVSSAMIALVVVVALNRQPKVPAASWAEISGAIGITLHGEGSKSASRSEPILIQAEHVLKRVIESEPDTGNLVYVARRLESNNRDCPIIWTAAREKTGGICYVTWNAKYERTGEEEFHVRFGDHLDDDNVLTLNESLKQIAKNTNPPKTN